MAQSKLAQQSSALGTIKVVRGQRSLPILFRLVRMRLMAGFMNTVAVLALCWLGISTKLVGR